MIQQKVRKKKRWVKNHRTKITFTSQYCVCECSIQSCSFVQCWPGIFLVQCQENLCNVGAAFAATSYCQNINWFKIKIAKKWCYSDIALGFFLCNIVWNFLGNIAQDFCQCNIVPRVLQQYWTGFFHVKSGVDREK